MRIKSLAYFFIATISIVIVLIYGKSLLIPFVFAVLLWFLIRKIRNNLDKIPFFKNHLPTWIKTMITSVLILTVLGFFSVILTSNINDLADSYPTYEANVEMVIAKINTTLKINLIENIEAHITDFDFGEILTSVLNSLTSILSNTFIIILYALFVFLEEANFGTKLRALFHSQEDYEESMPVLLEIESSISHYFGLKTLVSLISGVLSYVALSIIGIDSPLFWAFLISILNYIPVVGALVGTLFPATFCLLQFGDLTQGALVLVCVGGILVLVGNVLEPKLMGNSLNISPLVTILSLSFWGALWGVTGMILSIPITVIMVIIFSQFESTRAVAIMLSEKGRIKKSSIYE